MNEQLTGPDVPINASDVESASGAVTLTYTAGDGSGFVEAVWRHLPAYPDGVLVGVIHQVGDRGQVQLQLSDPQVRQIELEPGQTLQIADPGHPRTWAVVDAPLRPGVR